MKKVLLPIAAAVILFLSAGAVFVKPSPVETPQERQKILIPISFQRGINGEMITDSLLWDKNKGSFRGYLVVEQ